MCIRGGWFDFNCGTGSADLVPAALNRGSEGIDGSRLIPETVFLATWKWEDVMTNANFSHGMQSRMARTVGVMLVLILLLSGGAPEAAAGLWVKRDWSRVQIVTPGTRTTVLLYKDRAPRGQREDQGRFLLGPGRIRHAVAAGRAEALSPQAGCAQGTGPAAAQEALPGMDRRRHRHRIGSAHDSAPGITT